MKIFAGLSLVVVLFCSGCMSRDISRHHADIVGREVTTLRDYYIREGEITTSVFWNIGVPAWALQDREYCEHYYKFSPGAGMQVGEFDVRYALVPAGTLLKVDAVRFNAWIDSGSETVATGTMVHPATQERVRWIYPYYSDKEAPWEPEREKPPLSR